MQAIPDVCDVLVVGSGAAGLSAALTAAALGLDVIVCEHAQVLGGTSALSGGEVWIPLNRQNRGGVADSHHDALAYLRATVGPGLELPRAEAFVRHAAEALAFLEDHGEVAYESLPHVVDYQSHAPGAKDGVRTLGALPFDGRRLGRHFASIRAPLATGTIFGGMAIGREDFPHLTRFIKSPRSFAHVTGMLSRHIRDRLAGHARGTRMVMGNALVGRLVASLLARQVPMFLDCRVTRLIEQDGRITGAAVLHRGATARIACRRGVILASGSFSGSEEMRRRHFPHAHAGRSHLTPLPTTNDGSGLGLAIDCGGALDADMPAPAAWAPMSRVPLGKRGSGVFPHFGDRAKPGVIVVNPLGRRFTNEAANYHDFLRAMLADADATGRSDIEAYIVTSHRHLRRYGLGRVPAFPGRIGPFLRNGYLARGATIAGLAQRIGIDAAALERTIQRFNGHAARGVDPDFNKGGTPYERAAGDASVSPNPCLAPLDEGPWYAIKMLPGDIGTMLGVRVDASSRVLRADGTVVAGLYAIGTAAASLMRGTYPAAGVMLGPALTFGYLAARELAALRPDGLPGTG
jgi:succinate dehydrogenase/fumarate reductase flavoprotein subunit